MESSFSRAARGLAVYAAERQIGFERHQSSQIWQPMERNEKYFLVTRDSPHEKAKWVLYTERCGFEKPEFQCANVREMIRYVNKMGPELARGAPDPDRHQPLQTKARSKAPRRKEAER